MISENFFNVSHFFGVEWRGIIYEKCHFNSSPIIYFIFGSFTRCLLPTIRERELQNKSINSHYQFNFFSLSQFSFQLIIEPKSMEKAIKLQLPIVLGTYPFRSTNDVMTSWPDSVLRPDTHYPSSLPVFRPSVQ